MKFQIINQQKIKKINRKSILGYLKKICVFISVENNPRKIQNFSSKEILIVFCDNKAIKKLNKIFFNRNTATDVIAFPLDDEFSLNYLGEVVISVEEAVKRCREYGNTWRKELILYVIHGILHILGYDDTLIIKKKIMEEKQEKILAKLFPSDT